VSARYTAAKRVVTNSQHEEFDGRLLDLWTASAMVAVYEALSPASQAKFDDMPFEKLVGFCLRSVSRA
jgi:hypothetical protein